MDASNRDNVGRIPTIEELDRERIQTYLDWGEVQLPRWWMPAYAVLVGGWIASYDLGPLWGTAGALILALAMGFMIRVATTQSQVTTPRFLGMPSSLRRTCIAPTVTATAAALAVAIASVAIEAPSYTLLGAVIGPALALSMGWQVRRYRTQARRIAAEQALAE